MAASELDFLAGPPLEVAPLLLGAVLRKDEVAVRITEVEAYDGAHDPGSHAFGGPTKRNQVMFGAPGFLYTYLIYGMHVCANVVCRTEGEAGAVLIRAGEVIGGLETARSRRPSGPVTQLAQGPGRLCKVLGIGLEDYGSDLISGSVTLEAGPPYRGKVATGPRVGLRHAAERPWRFWIEGDPTVSAYRPATAHKVKPPLGQGRLKPC